MKNSFCTALLLLLLLLSPKGALAQPLSYKEAAAYAASYTGVPQSFSEFHYKETENGWKFQWNAPKNPDIVIAIETNRQGTLLSYDYIDPTEYPRQSIGEEQAEAAARDFLAAAYAGGAGEWRKISGPVLSSGRKQHVRNYTFSYQFYVNDIPVLGTESHLAVHPYTGHIDSFYAGLLDAAWETSYPLPDLSVSRDAAKDVFLENFSFRLLYQYRAEETKDGPIVRPYLSYLHRGQTLDIAIDATDGSLLSLTKFYAQENFGGFDDYPSIPDPDGSAYPAIGSGFCNAETAEAIIRQTAPLIKETDAVKNAELIGHVWYISFKSGAKGAVEAYSRRLLSFSESRTEKALPTPLTEKQTQLVAEVFLEQIAPGQLSHTGAPVVSEWDSQRTFTYHREENGLPVLGNYLSATIDAPSGSVIGYQENWIPDAVFPEPAPILSAKEAFESFSRAASFSLFYLPRAGQDAALAYRFSSVYGIEIDPFSGQVIPSKSGQE